MVGNNLTDKQLQEIVDKTILYADKDGDGKISFQEFCDVSAIKKQSSAFDVDVQIPYVQYADYSGASLFWAPL